MPQTCRIYYLNKSWDAARFGHAAVLIDAGTTGVTYYSFFASRKRVPMCAGTLLVKRFATADEALAYAKTEGYTREMHWPITPDQAAAASAAILRNFPTGTRWRLFSRNCWHAVSAALAAAGVTLVPGGISPNAKFERNKHAAEAWTNLPRNDPHAPS